MVFWVSEEQRIMQRGVGFIEAKLFDEQTRRLMGEPSWNG